LRFNSAHHGSIGAAAGLAPAPCCPPRGAALIVGRIGNARDRLRKVLNVALPETCARKFCPWVHSEGLANGHPSLTFPGRRSVAPQPRAFVILQPGIFCITGKRRQQRWLLTKEAAMTLTEQSWLRGDVRYLSTGPHLLRRSRKMEITMTRMRNPNTASSNMVAFSNARPSGARRLA